MKNYWQLIVAGQGQSVLSKNMPLAGQQLSSGGPHIQKNKCMWEAQAELDGLKKKKREQLKLGG